MLASDNLSPCFFDSFALTLHEEKEIGWRRKTFFVIDSDMGNYSNQPSSWAYDHGSRLFQSTYPLSRRVTHTTTTILGEAFLPEQVRFPQITVQDILVIQSECWVSNPPWFQELQHCPPDRQNFEQKKEMDGPWRTIVDFRWHRIAPTHKLHGMWLKCFGSNNAARQQRALWLASHGNGPCTPATGCRTNLLRISACKDKHRYRYIYNHL